VARTCAITWSAIASEFRDGYFATFERLRAELVTRITRRPATVSHGTSADTRLLEISGFLIDYPFAKRLYPQPWSHRVLQDKGTPVILSDGDVCFSRTVRRSGLWQAFEGRVLIYIHKEQMLDDVMRRYPRIITCSWMTNCAS